jgi:hypothetical protein
LFRPSFSARESETRPAAPCPFEKQRQFLAGITPNPNLRKIKLSVGEPQHATPEFIKQALCAGLGGLAKYRTTLDTPALRRVDRHAGISHTEFARALAADYNVVVLPRDALDKVGEGCSEGRGRAGARRDRHQ